MARNIVPDPNYTIDQSIYSLLLQQGYRRSGDFIYRPHCQHCEQCRPCRISVAQFPTKKSQQRCLKKNQDLSLNMVKAGYSDEYFELYRSYLNTRHGDGGMSNPEPDDFKQFLYCSWSNSYFLEVRKEGKLLAVAVTDVTASGLSAVYTFFDPTEARRSLGTFCILQQIQQTKKMQLEHLY
ncbi:MAG: arginyltransferase, partial [Gammaproteobacteria bacterium]|nr:arginyltransferase [Gammaproteobacteria bacterium]